MIEDESYIRFRNQSQVQHQDYIEFTKANFKCESYVGRKMGPQEIRLDEDCAQDGGYIIIHEVRIILFVLSSLLRVATIGQ